MLSNKVIVRKMSDKSSEKSLGSNYVKPLRGLRKYITNKLMKFVGSYELNLEKRFPSTFRLVQTFTIDTERYTKGRARSAAVSASISPIRHLSIGLSFPKYMLSSHFWTLQQRIQFQVSDQTNKLYYYRPVFRQLQSKLAVVTIEDDLQEKCRHIFARLGSGTHPTVEQLLEVKQVFVDKPYGLQHLTSRHLTSLCRMHGLNALIGKRARLWNHIGFVREMDLAIVRDGFQSLSLDQIRKACFLRGLNPMSLSKEDMLIWLQMWTNIAQNVDRHSLSLLLHSPIFLAYNNPSNWRLIH